MLKYKVQEDQTYVLFVLGYILSIKYNVNF
jgi:hypothetical protein